MPPKERKSLAQWMLCEGCGCTVSNKDVMKHSESSCPPNLENLVHGFIKNKSIVSFTEEQKSNSSVLKHIPAAEHPMIVQLSQQAMQICRIGIGEPVTLEISGKIVVRTAWPTPEGSLMSVIMSRAGLDLLECKAGTQVKVCNLQSPPMPAQTVIVTQEGDADAVPADQVTVLLYGQHQGRIFYLNNVLVLKHLGLTLKFRVVKVLPYALAKPDGGLEDPEEYLVENMKSLGISDIPKGEQSFRVESKTVFQLQNSKNESGKETGHTESLADVGGLDEIIADLQEMMQLALSETNPIPGMQPSRGVLLYGSPGTGKSLLARTLCKQSGAACFTVQGPEIFSKFYGETEAKLNEIFSEASRRAPSIIFLDEVDVLCQRRGSGSQQEQRVVAALLAQLDSLQDKRVMVLAATSRPDAIDESVRRPGRLDKEIELPVPGPDARRQIMQRMLSRIPHQLSEAEVNEVARTSHGFVGADLLALCSQASAKAVKEARSEKVAPKLQAQHFEWALTKVKPSAMREVIVEIPSVRWTDIGGQHDLKLKLQQAIEWPLKHPDAFTRLGIRPPRGVLMYGPPGCSKTMIARALATESGLNFLSIKGPELFSKWVGESEKAVRAVFHRARQVAPSIVFFDEIDALCGERGGAGGGTNVQERVLAQLLTELDGVQPLGNVTVVAATNRPDLIDKALLRPGRLDRIVHVPLPDAATRREIFSLQFRKTPTASDVDINTLVDRTEGYSGAEVTAVCQEAALAALQDDITASQVEMRHCDVALTTVTPRTPVFLLELYAKYQQ